MTEPKKSEGTGAQPIAVIVSGEGAGTTLDLVEIWKTILARKLECASIMMIVIGLGLATALILPSTYTSEAVLLPNQMEGVSSGGSANGNLAGLAGIVGMDLGSIAGTSNDKSVLALEVMRSREFISNFIEKRALLVPLFAATAWDRATDQLLIDADIYDSESKEWVRWVFPPKLPKPSEWEATEEFRERLAISRNPEAGTIGLSFDFSSPTTAAQWLAWLIEDTNENVRSRDRSDAEKSIAYLNERLAETSVDELRRTLYELLEQQMQFRMMVEVQEEYALKVIDPPAVPDQHSSPNRWIIMLISLFAGAGLCFVYSLIRGQKTEPG